MNPKEDSEEDNSEEDNSEEEDSEEYNSGEDNFEGNNSEEEENDPVIMRAVITLSPDSVPCYTGETCIVEFLNQIEELGTLGNWEDANKIAIAKFKLRGAAREALLANETLNEEAVWNDFRKGLIARFQTLRIPGQAVYNLRQCKQRVAEPVRDYITRLKRAANATVTLTDDQDRNDFLKDKLEEDTLQQFYEGLHEHLALRVMTHNPATFTAACEIALREEINLFRIKGRQNMDNPFNTTNAAMGSINTIGPNNPKTAHQQSSHASGRRASYHNFNSGQANPARYSPREYPQNSGYRQYNSVNQLSRSPSPNRQNNSNFNSRAPTPPQNQSRHFQVRCFRCSRSGHVARNCRAAQPSYQYGNQSPRQYRNQSQRQYENQPQNQYASQPQNQYGLNSQIQPGDNITCFNCGEQGHFRSNCPFRETRNAAENLNQRRVTFTPEEGTQ